MNSLNIVSRLTTPPATPPPRSRTSSTHQLHTLGNTVHDDGESATPLLNMSSLAERLGFGGGEQGNEEAEDHVRRGEFEDHDDEKKPLLSTPNPQVEVEKQSAGIWQIPRRGVEAMVYGVRVVFSTITAPVRYVIACFYDEQGRFSAILPLQSLRRLTKQRRQISTAHAVGLSSASLDATPDDEKSSHLRRKVSKRRSPSVSSTTSTLSAASSDGDIDDSPARHTRSRTSRGSDHDDATAAATAATSAAAPRKSIRYKEETLRKRRGTKTRSRPSADDVATVASALKSPSSPVGSAHAMKLTRYPRLPAPPRPLVPRRQPSHALLVAPPSFLGSGPTKKTLIIDLDETLIHSMAKGGRMSTGHMVEVRMSASSPTMMNASAPHMPPSMATLPPILYYVHERPGCHEFLRKVCRWFRLVVFTASVQEYADPVIDWLERERKYFAARYYRQHCTFRNGAYIKDLAQVEPDLSKVMILDNSPMSYIFHEDNAIPIEGWISDPTDNDLLHLIPLLEGLQYVTDVRALLALRQGQAQQA